MSNPEKNQLALAILAGFFVARLFFAFTMGLGIDESYTIAISRRLCLSYFDHPPLHLWITHFAALAAGENAIARTPFIVLFFATGWIAYRFACRLFDSRAALVGLFALNVTPFFFASAGSWIVPDGPLLFGLAVAAWAASRLFFPEPLIGGLGLASLAPHRRRPGSGWTVEIQRRADRRRTGRVRTAFAQAAAVAQTSCAVCLGRHRIGDDNARHLVECAARLGVIRVSRGARRAQRSTAPGAVSDDGPRRSRFSVALDIRPSCRGHDERIPPLAGRPLPVSALSQFAADRSVHPDAALGRPWSTSLGDARVVFCIRVAGRVGRAARRLCSRASRMGLFFVGAAGRDRRARRRANVYGLAVGDSDAHSRFADPTLEGFEWRDLKQAPIFDQAPSFVISTKWSDAGKIALALGPQVPVFVLSNDPRGWAFLDESGRFVGQNGIIVTPAAEVPLTLAVAGPLFAELGQPQLYALGRRGRPEISLALIPARGLTRRLHMPYPGTAGR